MRSWMRDEYENALAGGYLGWVYFNPFDGRFWYN